MNEILRGALTRFCERLGFSPDNIASLDGRQFREAFNPLANAAGFIPAITWTRVLNAAQRKPDLIFDVGVRSGTPELYRCFKETPFVLVDPQKGGEALLQSKPKHYQFIPVGLGAEPGRLVLREQSGKSTFLERTELTKTETLERHEVEITTLDALIEQYAPEGSIGIKVDVEGFEMEVFRGLSASSAQRVDFIIVEASVKNRFEGGYHCIELLSLLGEKGFRFYNILNPVKGKARLFVDFMLLRHDDPAFD